MILRDASPLALLLGELSKLEVSDTLLADAESFDVPVGVCGSGSCLSEGSGGVLVRVRSISSLPSNAVAVASSDTVEVEVMERLAVGGKSGGVYCVPTSTDDALL